MGNRVFFAESDIVDLAAGPDGDLAARTHAAFCRPFHDAGPHVATVRAQLAARAKALGWSLDTAPLAGLHLVVDGLRIDPEVDRLAARFVVPASAKMVWLQSETSVPRHVGGGGDPRALGVCIGTLAIDDGLGPRRVIGADDPRPATGFHRSEGTHRWRTGRALLPAELWAGCRGSFFLRIDHHVAALRRAARGRPAPRHASGRIAPFVGASLAPRLGPKVVRIDYAHIGASPVGQVQGADDSAGRQIMFAEVGR